MGREFCPVERDLDRFERQQYLDECESHYAEVIREEAEELAEKWEKAKTAPVEHMKKPKDFLREKLIFKDEYFKSSKESFKRLGINAKLIRECITERWKDHLAEMAMDFLKSRPEQ